MQCVHGGVQSREGGAWVCVCTWIGEGWGYRLTCAEVSGGSRCCSVVDLFTLSANRKLAHPFCFSCASAVIPRCWHGVLEGWCACRAPVSLAEIKCRAKGMFGPGDCKKAGCFGWW